jgi:hypothetical protein
MGLCNTTNPRGVSLKLIYSLAAMGAVWEALSREAAMARGFKPVALFLTLSERETLQALVRRRSTHQDVARDIPPSRAQVAGSQAIPPVARRTDRRRSAHQSCLSQKLNCGSAYGQWPRCVSCWPTLARQLRRVTATHRIP